MIVLPTEYSLSNDKRSPLASIATETWALQAPGLPLVWGYVRACFIDLCFG